MLLSSSSRRNKSSRVIAKAKGKYRFGANKRLTVEALEARRVLSATGELLEDINLKTEGSSPTQFVALGDALYFGASDASGDRELWKTDGTTAGTVRVADIWPGSSSSNPSGQTVFGNELYFSAEDGVSGRELWKTDGTAAGTVQVADIWPGNGFSKPEWADGV